MSKSPTPAKKDRRTWSFTDHVCKACGGRIMQSASGNGPTPGGNPSYKCADCGVETSSMFPSSLCWCGYSHRAQHATAYVCQPFTIIQQYPRMKEAFAMCGCVPGRQEVGIMLEADYRKILTEQAQPGDQK